MRTRRVKTCCKRLDDWHGADNFSGRSRKKENCEQAFAWGLDFGAMHASPDPSIQASLKASLGLLLHFIHCACLLGLLKEKDVDLVISDSSLCTVDPEVELVCVCVCFCVFLRAGVVVGPFKSRLQRSSRDRGVSKQRHGAWEQRRSLPWHNGQPPLVLRAGLGLNELGQ